MTPPRSSPRRSVAAVLVAGLLAVSLVGAVPSPGSEAPSDPEWSVDPEDLAAAIECSDLGDEVGVQRQPVLLVHGTGTWGYEQYHWSYSALLDRLGLDWCTVTYPDRGTGDMQISAEYVAYAVQHLAKATGAPVDVVGHSQGALMPRWAIKYWPSVQALVDDFVMHAPPSHGTTVANPAGLGYEQGGQRPAVAWQFLPKSDFIRTLNVRDETPGDVDYTVLWSVMDQLVQPSYGPNPTPPLEGGRDSEQLTNVAIQDVCPGRVVDHLSIGTTDRVAAALTVMALLQEGPLDLEAVAAEDLCAGPDEARPFAEAADTVEEATGLPFGSAYRSIAGAFPDVFQRQESMTAPLDILAREGDHGFTEFNYSSEEPAIREYARSDLAALSPAPASEGAVTDTCRQMTQDDPQQPCDFLRAFTAGIAAACRTALFENGQCRWFNGQPVGDAQVDAYQDSWIASAHALQRSLQVDLPLRHAVFVATHNSYNGYGYTPTLSRSDANQTYSIYDQLRLDVRRIELDVHWWYDAEAPGGAPVTCHATAIHDVTPVTRHVGCTTEDTLDVALADVVAWLDDPRSGDEVLMIRFETHLENGENHAVAAAMIEDSLADELYRPEEGGCRELPLGLTTAQVREAGKRVVIVGGCGDGNAAWNAVAFDDDDVRTESTYRGEAYAYPSCGGQARPEDDVWYASNWVRRYEDATVVSSWSSVGGTAPQRVTPDLAREWARCGINQPSFDHLTPTDGRLEALVWSFDQADLTAPSDDCAQHGADGRFRVTACEEVAPAVCSDGTYGAFELSPGAVVRADAFGACGALGLTLAVPRTGYEAARLGDLLRTAGVDGAWIDLLHVDGSWRRGA